MVFEYTWIYYYYWSHAPLTMSIFWRIFSTTFYHKKLSKYCVAFVRTGTRTLYGTICTKQNKSSYVPYITTYFHFSSFLSYYFYYHNAMTLPWPYRHHHPLIPKIISFTPITSLVACVTKKISKKTYCTVRCIVLYCMIHDKYRYGTVHYGTLQHSTVQIFYYYIFLLSSKMSECNQSYPKQKFLWYGTVPGTSTVPFGTRMRVVIFFKRYFIVIFLKFL